MDHQGVRARADPCDGEERLLTKCGYEVLTIDTLKLGVDPSFPAGDY
jgi:hypothetical protein